MDFCITGGETMENNQIPKELMDKINTCIRHTRNEIAKQVVADLKKEYSTVIWKFYHHYKPHMYERTYKTLFATNLRQARGDYRKITKWNGDEFIVKFSVGAEFMEGEPYRDDPDDYVFQRTFEEGIHGWIPLNFQKLLSGEQNVQEMGWRALVKQPRKPLSPPPKARMDEWFNSYKTQGNLDKICKPILKKNLDRYLYNG